MEEALGPSGGRKKYRLDRPPSPVEEEGTGGGREAGLYPLEVAAPGSISFVWRVPLEQLCTSTDPWWFPMKDKLGMALCNLQHVRGTRVAMDRMQSPVAVSKKQTPPSTPTENSWELSNDQSRAAMLNAWILLHLRMEGSSEAIGCFEGVEEAEGCS